MSRAGVISFVLRGTILVPCALGMLRGLTRCRVQSRGMASAKRFDPCYAERRLLAACTRGGGLHTPTIVDKLHDRNEILSNMNWDKVRFVEGGFRK
ncbi:hypothetical protein IQ06DRAFT_84140 [Phaeosphaeriaceae sp. SRC1lsM3a]|nr:hypothetical protein IQ06DRAFT_84140 [Stagonospora sp. SRC1lsM3a]